MRKFYRNTIAIAILTAAMTVAAYNPVFAAEEVTEEGAQLPEGEAAGDGFVVDGEMTEGDMTEGESLDAMTSQEAVPSVATPDGNMVAGTFSDDLLPLLFHKTTTTYQGTSVEAAQFDNGYVLLLYVTDSAGGNGAFKQYDETTGELKDFRMIAGPNESYIIVLPLLADTAVPEGFEEVILDWNGQTFSAYTNTTAKTPEGSDVSVSDYLLLYAVSSTGRQGFYLYDQVEGTYQRYLNIVGTVSKSSGDGILAIDAIRNGDSDALVRLIIMAALLLLVIVLVVLVIIFAVRLREYSEYDYIDEDEYNAMNRADKSLTGRLGLTGRMPRTGTTGRMPVVEDERSYEPQRNSYEKEAPSKAAPSREVSAKEMPAREMPSRETPAKETPAKEMPAKEMPAKEMPANEIPSRNAAVKNESGKSAPVTERPVSKSRPQQQERQYPPQRRSLLETCDIADLDDILNDPNLTSNLPVPSEIRREIERQNAAKQNQSQKETKPHSYEDMQVTVDKYDAGMPADIDTDIIAEDIGTPKNPRARDNASRDNASRDNTSRDNTSRDNASRNNVSRNNESRDGRGAENYTQDRNSRDRYSNDRYSNDRYSNDRTSDARYANDRNAGGRYPEDNYTRDQYETDSFSPRYDRPYQENEDDDDYYYLSRAERKERKALEKQRRREAKEAEKDAKYLERERRRAEKHKKYGYDEATPMDWSALGDSLREESTAADDRRPTGYNEENLPSYMKNPSPSKKHEDDRYYEEENKRPVEDRYAPSEEEKANAAADAVIAAARGNSKSEREYREYRKSARNQYEDFRREDELRASQDNNDDDSSGNGANGAHTGASNIPQAPKATNVQMPVFSEDIDEDFEFEFLNIRRPQ